MTWTLWTYIQVLDPFGPVFINFSPQWLHLLGRETLGKLDLCPRPPLLISDWPVTPTFTSNGYICFLITYQLVQLFFVIWNCLHVSNLSLQLNIAISYLKWHHLLFFVVMNHRQRDFSFYFIHMLDHPPLRLSNLCMTFRICCFWSIRNIVDWSVVGWSWINLILSGVSKL